MRKLLLAVNLLLFLCISLIGVAQERRVTGKVTNARGEAVPSASVVIKGTTTGTTTDEGGNFSISVPDNNTILLVSYAGYLSQEIRVGGSNMLSVSLP